MAMLTPRVTGMMIDFEVFEIKDILNMLKDES